MAEARARAATGTSLPGGMPSDAPRPITDGMRLMISFEGVERSFAGDLSLLRACFAMGGHPAPRVPARLRLERAVGNDLAGRLLRLVCARR